VSMELGSVADWWFTFRSRASACRGVGFGALSSVIFDRFGGLELTTGGKSCRQPAATTGVNVFRAEPRGVPRLEELETASSSQAGAGANGPCAAHGVGELARPSRVKRMASEPSGPHRLYLLTDRAQNPMGACRVKQTGEVPGGESRQEGVKP
jgi:hypothetical protein